jgi:Isopeptidase T
MTEWVVQPDGGRPEGRDCPHAAAPSPAPAPRRPVCPECFVQGHEETRLRLCLTCGHIGCSDSAPGAHATAHYASSGHPLARSMDPSGEPWAWCYVDEVFLHPRDGHSTE